MTCQNMSEKLTKQNEWTPVNQSNLVSIAKGRLDSTRDVYILKVEDEGVKMLVHDRKSNLNGLVNKLGEVGVNVLTSTTRNQILNVIEGLKFSFEVQQIEKAGFGQSEQSGENYYCLPNGAVIGAFNSETTVLPPSIEEVLRLERSGDFKEWEKIVAPIVRGRPIPISILGQSLLPVLRSSSGTKVSKVQQGTLLLCRHLCR